MPDYRAQIFPPDDVYDPPSVIQTWDSFPVRFLAQGDSWFSFGDIPPIATSNILGELTTRYDASIVNCANPGRRLARMIDWKMNPDFRKLLSRKFGYRWDGILLSAGGNDLISAAGVLPLHPNGSPVPKYGRLLLNPDEWGPPEQGPERYLSAEGWKVFCDHLVPQFGDLVKLRDELNQGVPLFCHTYAYTMPRDAPAWKFGPWLYPSVKAYGIPETDWLGVGTALVNRLASLLRSIVADLNAKGANIHLVETEKALKPAEPDTTGPSNDWQNEIHPTRRGYRKLADMWRPVIEAALG